MSPYMTAQHGLLDALCWLAGHSSMPEAEALAERISRETGVPSGPCRECRTASGDDAMGDAAIGQNLRRASEMLGVADELRAYVEHAWHCDRKQYSKTTRCTCGLDAVLDRFDEGKAA